MKQIGILVAAGLSLAAPAEAQYDARASAALARGGYSVEVAPPGYVVQRAGSIRDYPYAGCGGQCAMAPSRWIAGELRRPRARNSERRVLYTTKIVRDRPVVIERRRIVNDPPRVIERLRYEAKAHRPAMQAEDRTANWREAHAAVRRVIHAEAEVMILGPDRMSIRLYRKRGRAR